jgi:small subunit ribosomal protein S2
LKAKFKNKIMSETVNKKEIAKQYVKASVHYGPSKGMEKMAPYILYAKYGYHIFDLVKHQTIKISRKYFTKKKRKKWVLFVGTNRLSSSIIAKKRCDAYYINYRWLGGMLTNGTRYKIELKD